MRLLPLLLVVAGCAATGTDRPSRDQEALSRELSGLVAGEPETCISATSSSGLTIVDRQTLTYRQGRTLWVNRLPAECPGLRPLATLIVEVQGSRYCRYDRVRAIEAGASIPGPTCLLGDFTPYRAR